MNLLNTDGIQSCRERTLPLTPRSRTSELADVWEYIGACTARGAASPRTRAAYGAAIGAFLGWCGGRGLEPLAAARRDIEDWRGEQIAGGAAPGSVMLRLSAVKTLYKALMRAGKVAANPAEFVKSPKPVEMPVEAAMRKHIPIETMMGVLGKITDDARGRRDRAAILVMYVMGLRVSEAVGLDWGAWGGDTLAFTAKGAQARELAVPELIKEALAKLREGVEGPGPVFLGKGGRISVRGMQKMVAARLKAGGLGAAGRGGRSPHALRHSCGNNAAIEGCNSYAIQDQLGHADQKTTGIYTKVAARFMEAPSMAIAKRMGV